MTRDFQIHWIDTPAALEAMCEVLAEAPQLAVDTEFFRETSFHPVPGLVQLCAEDQVYLVDPQALAASEALCRLLGPEGPLKLIHASSEDIEVLRLWYGKEIAPFVDTQLAQALLGDDPAMGYQRLVEHWTGDSLPKDETRSNWLERPLSASQCRYAALDVVYLPPVWERQRQALEELGRLDWLEDDCAHIAAQVGRGSDDDQWYRRHRQLWRLEPRAIAAYQRLTAWREAEARRRDTPRNWLVSDKVLFAIASAQPKNRFELAAVEGVKPSLVKREGDTLLGILGETARLETQALPEAIPSPLSASYKKRLKALKQQVNGAANELGLAPEILARRRQLDDLVVADLNRVALPLPTGWRGELLADPLRQALENVATERS
jgi:ribonuclease D